MKLKNVLLALCLMSISNLSNAGVITLTDELKTEIQSNGTYTQQIVSADLSVEFWLMDNFALVTHNYEEISFLSYTSFSDGFTNADVENFHVADTSYWSFRDERAYSILQTFQTVDFLDIVYELPSNLAFTGVEYISKPAYSDYLVYGNNFANLITYESIGVLAFQDPSTIGQDPTTDVPEPSSIALFSLALLVLLRVKVR